MAIIYTPEGRRDARDFPRRVYFSCHDEDFVLLDVVEQQLRQIIDDCVIAFREPGTAVEPTHFEEVEDFPLAVIVVTQAWFREGLHQQEFALLKDLKKPMIPILLDDTLVERFNVHTDEMQFLRRSDPEYPEKLERALMSLLVDQETTEKVHKVFTHKLFIAYCQEDLEQVRQLIRCIHQVESGRQISVWFDKYLQTGRNFEEVILSQLDDSQLFGMVLTPRLVQRDTYVKRQEYPRALAGEKRMVVFQLAEADWQTLRTELEKIAREQDLPAPKLQQPVVVSRDDAFAAYIRNLLREVKGESDIEEDRERDYLLGLAYRNGIGVEFDYRYAMTKFMAAADKGEYRAAHCLADMFYNGIGVRRDLKQAKKWYVREIRYLFDEYKKQVALIKQIPIPITELENGLKLDLTQEVAGDIKANILNMAGTLVWQTCLNARILRDIGYWDEAEDLYRMAQKALEWSENNVNQVGVAAKFKDDLENELNQFLIFRGKRDVQACRKVWNQALAAWQADDPDSCFTAIKSGHNFATVLLLEGQAENARQVMEQAAALIEGTHGTLQQNIREIQLLLYRDIGKSYLLQNAGDEAQQKENAAQALTMLQKELQLLTEYPLDTEDNPYLLFLRPYNSLLTAKAYSYSGDHRIALFAYLQALEEVEKIQIQLEDISTQRDLPLEFLQLYAEIAKKLSKYPHIPDELIKKYQGILEQFEGLSYNAEHQFIAQEFLERIRTTLKIWKNKGGST